MVLLFRFSGFGFWFVMVTLGPASDLRLRGCFGILGWFSGFARFCMFGVGWWDLPAGLDASWYNIVLSALDLFLGWRFWGLGF